MKFTPNGPLVENVNRKLAEYLLTKFHALEIGEFDEVVRQFFAIDVEKLITQFYKQREERTWT